MSDFRTNIGPATIYSSSELNPQIFLESLEVNAKIWGRAKPFNIYVCEKENEFKLLSRQHYFPFAKAVVHQNGDLVVRSEKNAKISRKKYKQVLVHEMNHAFWLSSNLGSLGWQPFWLFEATACYAAHNDYLINLDGLMKSPFIFNEQLPLPFRYKKKYLSTRKQVRFLYSIWYHFLRYIIDNDGRTLSLFLQSLQKMNKQVQYRQAFRSFFAASEQELVREFLDEQLTSSPPKAQYVALGHN